MFNIFASVHLPCRFSFSETLFQIFCSIFSELSFITDNLDTFNIYHGFPGGSEGKESACSVGDLGSIPGLGRSPGEGMVAHFNTLAWRIPWTEKPGRLQFIGSLTVGYD